MDWAALAGGINDMHWKRMEYQQTERQYKNNRADQLYYATTAHQREVADLRAAGLNPILSAMGGNGANGGAPTTTHFNGGNGNPFVTAMQMKLLKSQIYNTNVDSMLKDNQMALNNTIANYQSQLSQESSAREKNINVQTKYGYLGLPGAKTESEIDESKYGEWMRYLDRGIKTLNPFANSAKTIKSTIGDK